VARLALRSRVMILAPVRLDKAADNIIVEPIERRQALPSGQRKECGQPRLWRSDHLPWILRHKPLQGRHHLRTRLFAPVVDNHAAVFEVMNLNLPRDRNPV
jgi:hypothetical protein